jgi:general nucleoside transport system ATP-binding protein
MAVAVEMRDLTKKFGSLVANKKVNFLAEWGQIHGLIGENGAGKTTLMKTLYGMYAPDEGEMFIDSKKVDFSSPLEAIKVGIGMVHQHFTLVPSLTVAENIMMGRPIVKKGLLDMNKAYAVVKEMSEKFGLEIDPKAIVKDLPVGLQQRVEILKALYLGADILILDEPTAVLTPQEIGQLFVTLKSLKAKGKTIILITHKLKELLEVTDVITVMRMGEITGRVKTFETSEKEIARMMVGREVIMQVHKDEPKIGRTELSLRNIECFDNRGVEVLRDISLNLRAGEIVGIAGVQGNGQTELIEVIAGLRSNYKGAMTLGDKNIDSKVSPMNRRRMGLGHIAEDRQTMGAALNASILENFIMMGYRKSNFGSRWAINYKKAEKTTWEEFQHYDVRTSDIRQSAYTLSGGNLQKVIIARELFLNPSVLIAAQPSRGVDIGATQLIHQKLIEKRNQGTAILLISYELSEIMSLSDRILVMYNGSIVGETTPNQSNEEEIGLLMAGIRSKGGDLH